MRSTVGHQGKDIGIPIAMLTGAAAYFNPSEHREYKNRGTYGAASEVRRIDPKNYKP